MTSPAWISCLVSLALAACREDAAPAARAARANTTDSACDTISIAERRAIGGLVYFVSEQGGNGDVYSVRPSGEELTRVTRGSGDEFPAAAAKDGHLAIVAVRAGDDPVEAIEILPVGGQGAARAVVPASARARSPSWAPDGSWLAFEGDRESFRDVYRVNADGTGLRRLTDNREGNFEPAVSPDGRWIAFASSRDGDAEIYVMAADGSGQRRLTAFHRDDWSPRWSPDGRWIAFTSSREGRDRVFLVRPDGTSLRRLSADTTGDASEADPAWSPDGAEVALVRAVAGGLSIQVVDVATGAAREIGRGPVRQPAWSPDGRFLAFVAGAEGEEDLYLSRADGGGATRLTRSAGADWLPRWSRR